MAGFTIRKATTHDIAKVRKWLQKESDAGHHSFISNIVDIEEGQESGWVTVLVDHGFPIAFALGDTNLMILAVKRERRRDQIGTKLASHWIEEGRRRDLFGFYGECSPTTSVPFWKSMGCKDIDSPWENGKPNWIALPFQRKHELPEGVPTTTVSFEIHRPDGSHVPIWDFSTQAAVVANDDYMLAEDFVACVPQARARLTIRDSHSVLCQSEVSDFEKYGAIREFPWIRVREFSPA